MLSLYEISDPIGLYKTFYADLSGDFKRDSDQGRLSRTEIETRVLKELDRTLETLGRSINDFKLGNIEICRNPLEKLTRELQAEYNIPVSVEDLASVNMLNNDHRVIYDRVMSDILSSRHALYFVDGLGGSGKTFLYKALLATTRFMGHVANATASSGIAATLLPGGRTAHSRFRIPLEGDEGKDTQISKSSGAGYLIAESKLIIWDEAPMGHRKAIEKVDESIRDICESDQLFGGKVVVFRGDFLQTLPIVEGGTRAETIDVSLIMSDLCQHFNICKLTINMRARIDPQFSEFLMRIGDGTEPQTECGRIRIPPEMLIPWSIEEDSLQRLINAVYSDLSLFHTQQELMCSRAIVAPKNVSVDEINEALILHFPGESKTYKSVNRALNNQDETHYSDFLNLQHLTGMRRHELSLKINCPVVLLHNINPLIGFANGTRLICRSLDSHVIGVEIVYGQFKGTHGFIPRISFSIKEAKKYVIPFTRQQFPLKLAFDMTINKLQGQTLDFVGVYLRQPVFSPGQLYVALSQAKTSENVKVLIGSSTENSYTTDLTKNEVFHEVLQLAAA